MGPWLLAILKKIFSKVGPWVVPYVLNWIKDQITKTIAEAKRQKDNLKKRREALKKYEAVVKNPNATTEEKDRAKEEFLNS